MRTISLYELDFMPTIYTEILYQAVYGIFAWKTEEKICNNLIALSQQYESEVLRKALLIQIKNEYGTIISNLDKRYKQNETGAVFYPHFSYLESTYDTIRHYKFAQSIISLLLESNTPPSSNIEYHPIKDYNIKALQYSPYEKEKDTNVYVDFLRIRQFMLRGISKKQEFKNETEYKTIGELKESIQKEIESNIIQKLNTTEDKKKAPKNEISAVIYYMLKDKVDNETIIKIANYAVGDPYNSEIKRKNTNSVSRYLKNDAKNLQIKGDTLKEVVKILKDYEFEIDKDLLKYE